MDRDSKEFLDECELSDRVMSKLLEGNPIYEASDPKIVVETFGKSLKKIKTKTVKFRRYENPK